MNEFEQKRRIKRILLSPAVLVILAVILVLMVRGTWAIYQKNRSSSNALNLSEDRLLKLQSRENELSGMIEKLHTESGVEGEIRDRFQMAKEGEREIVIVEDAGSQNNSAVSLEKTFFQRIKSFFTDSL